ncbi:MAG: metallophosphoesterase [Pirellulales bacterium]
MRLAWLTDIHLNFCSLAAYDELIDQIEQTRPDALVVTGDIAEAHSVVPSLERLDRSLRLPLYFVLGNHDFYFGSMAEVRRHVADLSRQRERLVYLSRRGPIRLAPQVGLIGHDGWADARYGDYVNSAVMLNDYRLIRELAPFDKASRQRALRSLGDEAAAHVRSVLPDALALYRRVVFATHVPPLLEACWHEGRLSDDEWSPHFTCKAIGDALLEIMDQHPRNQLTVLCGHTHGVGECRPRDNIEIFTGGAAYGAPQVQRVFTWA